MNELDAAGILSPDLRAAYTECRRINAHHGRTFFLATRLLPARAFARMADELVGNPEPGSDPAASLDRVGDLVLTALPDTVRRYGIGRKRSTRS